MNPSDFVFNSVYKGAKRAGATELSSHQHAQICHDIYMKNKFSGKVSELIQVYIKMAVKESKRKAR